MHFYEFVANSAWKYNCLPTSKHRQAKVRRFLGICCYDCFIYRSNFAFQKCIETRHHLGCGRKTVNSQGYSELREPIKTRENCYSLIWWILKSNTCHRANTCLSHFNFVFLWRAVFTWKSSALWQLGLLVLFVVLGPLLKSCLEEFRYTHCPSFIRT